MCLQPSHPDKGFTSSSYEQPDVALTSTVGPFSRSWLWSEVHDLTVPGRLKFSITLEAALAALATLQNLKEYEPQRKCQRSMSKNFRMLSYLELLVATVEGLLDPALDALLVAEERADIFNISFKS